MTEVDIKQKPKKGEMNDNNPGSTALGTKNAEKRRNNPVSLVQNGSASHTERAKVSTVPNPWKNKSSTPKYKSTKSSAASRQGYSHSKPKSKVKPLPSVQSDELTQQLVTGTYECMVCYGPVKSDHRIWSCNRCFHIFHLRCIKKWANRPHDAVGTADYEPSEKEKWYCPGCRQTFDRIPSVYKCFCGRATNPHHSGPKHFHIPHSCGNLCKRPLATDPTSLCKHTCSLPCHPGPCPQCPAMTRRSCPCGKKSQQVRCSLTGEVPTCGAPCYRVKSCGKHRCLLTCHSGPCPPCDSPVEHKCHCGREVKVFTCGQWSRIEREGNSVRELTCSRICNKALSCGNHRCEQSCHPGDCGPCALLPENVATCPCGKLDISELLPHGEGRVSCLDPVPTCGNICERKLPCSTDDEDHLCKEPCHHGDCPDCPNMTTVKCRCGRSSKAVECCEVRRMDVFTCEHVCNKKKRCGKHRCNARCCNKGEHICDLICGKKLRCGRHTCTEVCHSGHCDRCWETSFDELKCDCGSEVLYPPIPCGTPPPPCNRLCSRVHPCDHPVYHTCHTEDTCPPCTVRTTKICRGGHKECSVPCFLNDVSCGSACGRSLPCGHNCIKTCHKGACLPNGEECTQPCPMIRKLCGHCCASPCHFGRPCPPDSLCREQITLKCACGRLQEESLCLYPNRDDLFSYAISSRDIACLMSQLASGHSINLEQLTELKSVKLSDRKLECDEVCKMEERNRKLREALDIQDAVVSPLLEKPNYTDFLCQMAKSVSDSAFTQQVEETVRQLVMVALKKSTPQNHPFPPANRRRRQGIHELAEAYGCDSQSFDDEPKRNVTVYTTRRSYLPSVPLMKYIHQKPSCQPRPANLDSIMLSRQKDPPLKTSVDYFEGDF